MGIHIRTNLLGDFLIIGVLYKETLTYLYLNLVYTTSI